MRRLRLTVTAVLASVLLSACVVRVAYNQLDWLALWFVEDYFDLNASQERQAKEMIGRTIDWHRETQLPRYASLLRTTLGGLEAPVDPRFLADRYGEVVVLWDTLLRQVAPDFARLLQLLTDEQVDELFENLADENKDLTEEYSGTSRGERQARRDKAIFKAFRRFTGRLSSGQEQLVRTHTARMHDVSAEWLERREAWQKEFRLLMAGRNSDPSFAARLEDLLLDPNRFDSPVYRKQVLENQQLASGLVAAVLDSLSAKQSEQLRTRLTTYAGDFEALVRERAAKPP